MNPFGRKRFSATVIGLAIFLTITEIWYGIYRDPIPDIYRGELYIGEGRNKVLVKDVEATLEIVHKTDFTGRRPWVSGHALIFTLEGEGASRFEKLGFQILKSGKTQTAWLACEVWSKKTDTKSRGYARYIDLGADDKCKPAMLGAKNFDEVELVTKTPSGTPIFLSLKRDTHIGIIQYLVLRYNHGNNHGNNTGSYGYIDTLKTSRGY